MVFFNIAADFLLFYCAATFGRLLFQITCDVLLFLDII